MWLHSQPHAQQWSEIKTCDLAHFYIKGKCTRTEKSGIFSHVRMTLSINAQKFRTKNSERKCEVSSIAQ